MISDLRAVKQFHGAKLGELPDPAADARPWVALATDYRSAWRELVRTATTRFDSALTATRREPVFAPAAPLDENSSVDVAGVPCPDCPPHARRLFGSQRAMRAHQAAAHGQRRCARNFINADGICPGCGHSYGSRARAIVHATKGKACADILIREGTSLEPATVLELDRADAATAKASRRAGHPTPLAHCPGPGRGPKVPRPGSLLAVAAGAVDGAE